MANMKCREKRGSMITEATICLPVFIIALITLGYLLKVIWIQESIFHDLVNESRKMAIECYGSSLPIERTLFALRMEEDIQREGFSELGNCDIKSFKCSGVAGAGDGRVEITYGYEVSLNLPIPIISKVEVKNDVSFRCWIGKSAEGSPMGFSVMKEAEDCNTVYVFPRAGEKYHRANCRYISVYPIRTFLSVNISKTYNPCKLCRGEELSVGAVIFVFSGSGKVYHKGGCNTVERYVVSMDQRDASIKGYTACSVCGG